MNNRTPMRGYMSPVDIRYIKEHYLKDTNRQIAKALGINPHTVEAWARRIDLPNKPIKRKINPTNDKFLRDNIALLTIKELANHYGCTPMTISIYMKKNNIKKVYVRKDR